MPGIYHRSRNGSIPGEAKIGTVNTIICPIVGE